MVWQVLLQFLFRTAFGLAAGMLVTSSRTVTSGFFRVHLWVLLGMNTLAALAAGRAEWLENKNTIVAMTIAACVGSYVGAVAWIYDRARVGRCLIAVVLALNLAAGIAASDTSWTTLMDFVSSGLLVGFVLTAMLLGHWYLNTPSMQLQPLKVLIVLAVAMVLVRGTVELLKTGTGVPAGGPSPGWWIVVALRWLSGIAGVLLLCGLTWQTLRIPNTQSATGILYVAVILVFLGELSAYLLSSPGMT